MARGTFKGDYIGFNPTLNQSEWGTPQHSPYGNGLRSTPPMAQVDYFPSYPYRGQMYYTGAQMFAASLGESLYARTHLYRGIAPLELQPLINKPYPYQEAYIGSDSLNG